jgi:lipopolysaccharide transport system ATP-binding protein
MSRTVVRIENLSKYYRLGTIGGATLSEDLNRWWAKVRGRPDPLLQVGMQGHTDRKGGQIWALRDISLEIKEGEILGVIGRNGAGKSTLLKILSRITAPTSGRALIHGRVGSLLEVGTGFHPELTGRENVYLNGTILGMTKSEVALKLDEIVAFANMEKFIDTPVKRYSSGMTVRLAFAVAAHLEPEILIVDEVLAVGDLAFQKRCLGKMDEVAKQGRTVLLVSHNMATIKLLCGRCILLDQGAVTKVGPAQDVVTHYFAADQMMSFSERVWTQGEAPGDSTAKMRAIKLQDKLGKTRETFNSTEPINLEIRYSILEPVPYFRIGISLCALDGTQLFYSSDDDVGELAGEGRQPGEYVSRVRIPHDWLNVGAYFIQVTGGIFGVRQIFGTDIPRMHFNVVAGHGPTSRFNENRRGFLCPVLDWTVCRNGEPITVDA